MTLAAAHFAPTTALPKSDGEAVAADDGDGKGRGSVGLRELGLGTSRGLADLSSSCLCMQSASSTRASRNHSHANSTVEAPGSGGLFSFFEPAPPDSDDDGESAVLDATARRGSSAALDCMLGGGDEGGVCSREPAFFASLLPNSISLTLCHPFVASAGEEKGGTCAVFLRDVTHECLGMGDASAIIGSVSVCTCIGSGEGGGRCGPRVVANGAFATVVEGKCAGVSDSLLAKGVIALKVIPLLVLPSAGTGADGPTVGALQRQRAALWREMAVMSYLSRYAQRGEWKRTAPYTASAEAAAMSEEDRSLQRHHAYACPLVGVCAVSTAATPSLDAYDGSAVEACTAPSPPMLILAMPMLGGSVADLLKMRQRTSIGGGLEGGCGADRKSVV